MVVKKENTKTTRVDNKIGLIIWIYNKKN